MVSALFGIYLLSCGIIGWFFGIPRALLIGFALGDARCRLVTDLVGVGDYGNASPVSERVLKAEDIAHGKDQAITMARRMPTREHCSAVLG
jgi:hypothetical protein